MSSEKDHASSIVESPSPFTEGGKCFDEVLFIFDDQQNLFVSQNFLILASPVFEAMFKSDFKEKQTMTVHLKGKIYEDFLEFLMCIHPGDKTTVTTSNVIRIAPIAEEYQVARVIHTCTKCMKAWLTKELTTAQKQICLENCVLPARNCLKILKTAALLNNDELIAHAVQVIARFGHRIYYGSYQPDIISEYIFGLADLDVDGENVTAEHVIKDCGELFKSLLEHIRCEILSNRLAYFPDDDMK